MTLPRAYGIDEQSETRRGDLAGQALTISRPAPTLRPYGALRTAAGETAAPGKISRFTTSVNDVTVPSEF